MVSRSRLLEKLDRGAQGRVTLVSAPAGFGKTTLVSKWAAGCGRPVAWLSLDERDNDPASFLTYIIAALQTIAPDVGTAVGAILQSPQPPPAELILTELLNEIATLSTDFVLALDDYHVLDSGADDEALTFLVEHLPPQMHLVIATREDPRLPLARMRARGQLTELRAADLRFTPAEAADFLKRTMGLDLSEGEVVALDARTEGWIAGLQMAAISLQGVPDAADFISSFTGSHRFVLDYLLEEVLRRQPAALQTFLLRSSILERLCGPLCDAVLGSPPGSGERSLQIVDRANLFIVPLDDERCWYRYHHLFRDLLHKQLSQELPAGEIASLHVRASEWYEESGQLLDAFRHATLAGDIDRGELLLESMGMDFHRRAVLLPVVDWLASLPRSVLDYRPSLWVRWATLSLVLVQTTGVEERLQAAEKALQAARPDAVTRDLQGQIACARATLALTHYDHETMLSQAKLALACLDPTNVRFRFTAAWTAATAHVFAGDRAAAARACEEVVAIGDKSGNPFSIMLAAQTQGLVQELDNQLVQAAVSYRRTLEVAGDQPLPQTVEVLLGLARIHYQWNDLETVEEYGRQSRELARFYDRTIDRSLVCDVLLARLALARDDVDGAANTLAQAERTAREKGFVLRLPDIAAARVLTLIRQGQVAAAEQLASEHQLPLEQARVQLALGDPATALALLEPYGRQTETRGWADERLKTAVLRAMAQHAAGEGDAALTSLAEALSLAEPGNFIRLFVDEGSAMAELLQAAAGRGIKPEYVGRLLDTFETETKAQHEAHSAPASTALPEPLSPRELEVLHLIAEGLSNKDIGRRLFLALDTVKGHNRRIFEKLHAQRRTEAIARAKELGLL